MVCVDLVRLSMKIFNFQFSRQKICCPLKHPKTGFAKKRKQMCLQSLRDRLIK